MNTNEKRFFLTRGWYNFEWFLRLEWLAEANLVFRVYSDEVLMILLEIANHEFLYIRINATNFHPHGFLYVPDCDFVKFEWGTTVVFWPSPFYHNSVAGYLPDLQWRGRGRWNGYEVNKSFRENSDIAYMSINVKPSILQRTKRIIGLSRAFLLSI